MPHSSKGLLEALPEEARALITLLTWRPLLAVLQLTLPEPRQPPMLRTPRFVLQAARPEQRFQHQAVREAARASARRDQRQQLQNQKTTRRGAILAGARRVFDGRAGPAGSDDAGNPKQLEEQALRQFKHV